MDDRSAALMAEPHFWPLYFFDDEALEEYDERSRGHDGEGDTEDDAKDDAKGDAKDGAKGGAKGGAEGDVFTAEFPLDDGLGLRLVFEPGACHVDLSVVSPESAEAETVGWDDTAHSHPHVMPWAELDLLGRAAAVHDPALRHPGPMTALLLRFAFLSEEGDEGRDEDTVASIAAVADAAFAAVRPTGADGRTADGGTADGVREETRDWLDLRDLRGAGVEWTVRPDGCRAVTQHGPDGVPLHSLRHPVSDGFPFAAWSLLLARATELLDAVRADPALRSDEVRAALGRCTGPGGHRHLGPLADALSRAGFARPGMLRALSAGPVVKAEAAWVVETLAGLERGRLTAAWCGRGRPAGGRSWRLSLTLPAAGRPRDFGQRFAAELSAALNERGLGRAEAGGGTYTRDENGDLVRRDEHLDVVIRDDLPAGTRVVAELLHRHQVAETAVLRHAGKPYADIPLDGPPA